MLQDEHFLERKRWDFDATPAGEAPAAAALPPARALPPPGDQADRRRARHVSRRPPLQRRREAPHVRLLRPAHDRRLDAIGVHPERDRLRDRLPRRRAALLPRRLHGRPARHARQHRRRHPHRLMRWDLARPRRRLRRPARQRRRRALPPPAARAMGAGCASDSRCASSSSRSTSRTPRPPTACSRATASRSSTSASSTGSPAMCRLPCRRRQAPRSASPRTCRAPPDHPNP